jgi:methionyl aminopeptidase
MESRQGPKCQNPVCQNSASQQCPKCVSLNLEPSFFCSQTCFKECWGWHKLIHEKSNNSSIPSHFEGFVFTGSLRPGIVSPKRTVPPEIQKPEYAETGEPISERASKSSISIDVKNSEQIEGMRASCRIAREVLDIAGSFAKVGVTTDEIDKVVHEAIISRGAYPSTLNYRGFPKSCCTSVNEVICHGIPDSRALQDGDILNIDITVFYKGFHGDINETYLIGNVDKEGRRLVKATYDSLEKAIAMVKPGALYRDVGNVIAKHINAAGFSVVKSYCGHGIGELFHTSPSVPHYGKNKAVGVMKAGHTFTIEPMINEGNWMDVLWPDNWTSVTKDGKRSAQFEHTLLVTETGCEVLTARKS